MSLHKILCPIDFSPCSRQAMRVAVRLATERDAGLVLVHVWYVPPIAFAGEYPFSPAGIQQMSDDAQRALDAATHDAMELGAKRVTSKLLTGLPWSTIVDHAQNETDLIVIGTHGRTGLARILLGSVAETVIRHAPCSVLAVRPDGEPKPFAHVLCPIDFTDSSRHAMELAGELASPDGAGIMLLHVLELPVAYSQAPLLPHLFQDLETHASGLLAESATQLKRDVPVPVTTRLRIGRAGAEVLAVLDDDRTLDIVVLGSHGRTGLQRALLGSVAETVVRHARCPVLVARRRAS